MTTTKKTLLSAALLAALGAVALTPLSAQAITLDTTSAENILLGGNPGEPAAPSLVGGDGILQSFTGIDWNRNGAAWIQNFILPAIPVGGYVGTTVDFTLTYQAFAGTLSSPSPTPDLYVASPGSATGTYEVTTYAVLYERATCVTFTCNIVTLSLTPGQTNTYTVYFDTSPDADQSAGTGFIDGDILFSGEITYEDPSSVFSATGAAPGGSGSGSANISGTVIYTNPLYINPALTGTAFSSDIDFPGEDSPDFTRPDRFNGVLTGDDTATDFVVQIDSRQTITAVPEPASLALLGIGLLGMGTLRRRRA